MALKALRFIGLLFAVLGFTVTFAHVLEIPGQRALDATAHVQVAHTFYVGYAVTGATSMLSSLSLTNLTCCHVRVMIL